MANEQEQLTRKRMHRMAFRRFFIAECYRARNLEVTNSECAGDYFFANARGKPFRTKASSNSRVVFAHGCFLETPCSTCINQSMARFLPLAEIPSRGSRVSGQIAEEAEIGDLFYRKMDSSCLSSHRDPEQNCDCSALWPIEHLRRYWLALY